MDKDRKIVFIIGNGFDLDLGLKTSYKNFYESEYCPKDYPAPIIQHLNNKDWRGGLDAVKWYDLENELLNYYSELERKEIPRDIITEPERTFIKAFNKNDPARERYSSYDQEINALIARGLVTLVKVENVYRALLDIPLQEELLKPRCLRDKKALKLIKEGLVDYLNSISENKDAYSSVAFATIFALTECKKTGHQISIYNFNYTPLPDPYRADYEDDIYYVHGTSSNRDIIVGTKDDNISGEYDFLQKSFDPKYAPPAIVYDMLNADKVVIFGHSLGTNDSQYFKAFFKQQSSADRPIKKDITIFTKDDNSEIEIKRALKLMTDNELSSLFSLNNLEFIKTDNIYLNPESFRPFLRKHLIDERQVNVQIRQLKDRLTE